MSCILLRIVSKSSTDCLLQALLSGRSLLKKTKSSEILDRRSMVCNSRIRLRRSSAFRFFRSNWFFSGFLSFASLLPRSCVTLTNDLLLLLFLFMTSRWRRTLADGVIVFDRTLLQQVHHALTYCLKVLFVLAVTTKHDTSHHGLLTIQQDIF